MASKATQDDAEEFKCDNANNPQKVQWYTEIGSDLGQWYLSLRGHDWVYQPAQHGHNKFLAYLYQASTYGLGVIPITLFQTDDNKYNPNKKCCVATKSNSQLEAVDLPEKILNDWVPLDPRMINAKIHENYWVLESIQYPGYCLSYNSTNISSKSTDPIPVILVKEGEPNWENRFVHANDSGRQNGIKTQIFVIHGQQKEDIN